MARCASIRTLVAAAALGLLLLALAPTTLGRGLQQSPSPSPPQGAPADAFAPNGATDPFAASLPPPTSTPESQFGLAPGIGQPGGEPARLPIGRLPALLRRLAALGSCTQHTTALPVQLAIHCLTITEPLSPPCSGEPRRNYTGVATVAYQQDPLDAYGAVKLGCGLGFVSPTFQVGGKEGRGREGREREGLKCREKKERSVSA